MSTSLHYIETKQEIADSFFYDLTQLLAHYKAELIAEDRTKGYTDCGCTPGMEVDIPAKFDHKGNLVREGTTIDLKTFVNSKTKLEPEQVK